MILPGLALFYAGLVQARNVLSVMVHCLAICCLASALWLLVVYRLAFAAIALGGNGQAEGIGMGQQLLIQIAGVAATVVLAGIASYVIVVTTRALVGLRVDEDAMAQGLEQSTHGEGGYSL